jgi:glycosyltransferase involved in cell wall biosynthesis
MTVLVSILMPAYNAERWIAASIRSALSQTWERKEIIIIDDGSSDRTSEIAKGFESGNVKVITQENRGASVARNRALDVAQGDYIQWLDADDLLAPEKITRQLAAAEGTREDRILYSGPYGVFHHTVDRARYRPSALWKDLKPVDWLIASFSERAWMVPAVWLISRQLTERAGRWDERLSLNDDGEYVCRVVLASESIRFVPDAFSYYRSSGFKQLSRSTSDPAMWSLLLSAKLSIEHLRAHESTARTRDASLALLQLTSQFFFPDQTEFQDQITKLAKELDGELMPRKWTWRISLMAAVLGWRTTGRVISAIRRARLATAVKLDHILSR